MAEYFPQLLSLFFLAMAGLGIAQGFYWLKTGKSYSWYSEYSVSKEQNPGEYWLYVGLSLGIGILVLAISLILLSVPLF